VSARTVRGRRVRRAVVLVVLAGAVAAGGVVAVGASGEGTDDPADTEAQAPAATALVRRTDLVEHEDLDGTLGYGDAHALRVGRSGTVTGVPAPGTVLGRGDAVAEVDGSPVPLVFGDKPLWRPLAVGDEGPDVAILEAHLVETGVATAAQLTVDEKFTSSTAAAVKRWQESLGRERTGRVEPGDVVVQPGPVRVSEQVAELGAPSPGEVVEVTATERRVTLDLAATRHDLVAAGDGVTVTLPDGTTVEGTVQSVGTVVTVPEQGGTATVEVVITMADPAAGSAFDEAPVDVAVERSRAEGVLAVPVEALVALAEGGYAVEVAGSGGTTTLVGVNIGAFATGLVEVTGELHEGDAVVVPS